MNVSILVTVNVEPIEASTELFPAQLKRAAMQAITHAVRYGENEGFSHDLAEVTSIQVVDIQPGSFLKL